MRPHDDAQRPPACENCEREMTLLGRLSEIGIHKALRVYRCLPCQRITSTPLSYSGPLTEAVLLGGIASRFPKTTLKWDFRKMKFNETAANEFIKRDYRQGWQIKGLG